MDTAAWSRFETSKVESKLAYSEYNYASVKLDRAKINERLAEVKSQHEPIHSRIGIICEGNDELLKEVQELMFKALDYVVIGRDIR